MRRDIRGSIDGGFGRVAYDSLAFSIASEFWGKNGIEEMHVDVMTLVTN